MEPPSPARNCLVCGAPTTSAHYGVDACRACTVFYRKARKKQLYACRSSTRRCNITQDGAFACKRCRFDRFERILRQSGAKDRLVAVPPVSPSTQIPDLPAIDLPVATAQPTPRPLLEKSAICYKMMCAMRRNSELNARPNPPHPSKIIAGEYWTLAISFYNRMFMFDAAYRADKVYPDDMSKCLAAYTSYMSVDIGDHFFDDCPNKTANLEEAITILKKFIGEALPSTRRAMRRANLDKEEFHAVLVLTFWFADCLQMRDEIGRIGERYRQQVLKELQAYYREDLKLDDYAVRIGELFMLIFNFDRASDVQEQFEMYRLLGVFADDTFVYRLQNRSE